MRKPKPTVQEMVEFWNSLNGWEQWVYRGVIQVMREPLAPVVGFNLERVRKALDWEPETLEETQMFLDTIDKLAEFGVIEKVGQG